VAKAPKLVDTVTVPEVSTFPATVLVVVTSTWGDSGPQEERRVNRSRNAKAAPEIKVRKASFNGKLFI